MTPTPHPVMRLLAQGLPLSLLIDLAWPGGPDSAWILVTEPVVPGRLRVLPRPLPPALSTAG